MENISMDTCSTPSSSRPAAGARRPPSPWIVSAWLLPAGVALLGVTLLSGAAIAQPETGPPAARAAESDRLHSLFEREWEIRLQENPLFATAVGRHEYNHLLPAMSLEDLERRNGIWRQLLAEANSLEPTLLSTEDQVSLAIFRGQLSDRVESFRFGSYQIPITSDSGFHTNFAQLPTRVPLADTGDYESYIARLRAFPRYVDQHIAHMRSGLDRGMTMPQVVLQGFDVTIASHVVADPTESLFWAPFERFPPGVPERDRERLRREGRQAIAEAVVPGYAAFLAFMTEEYISGARTTLGASELPEGDEYYRYLIRHFTTLELSAEEIHQLGLAEVARIRGEMDTVIQGVGFEGSFDQFLAFLRTDPRFYAETPEELLKEAAWIAKRADAQMPAFFGRLPRLPYGVAPVPDHLAPVYTTGRYVSAPEGSTQPGYYWVNTYDLPSRPLYNLEALTLHEAVPGHHHQIALSQEMEGLPPFRRYSYLSAFGEGWGLYAEWLGLEMGFYTDPYSNFGRLTYEMWRACRLVVDTGIHAMGWSREQVMDYLAANTALPLHEVRTETDRYISWPGQALAYKIGELKIKELRERAEAALGERFDIRAFHDAVLENGSVPLPVLEQAVEGFIAASGGGS